MEQERPAAEPAESARGHRRRRSTFAVRRTFLSDAGLVDRFFFLAGGVASAGLGVMLVVRGLRFGWGYIAVVVVIWLLLAYLTLPRLHRILSGIYVPNYFIGRTRTSDGLLGDPVNVALMGDEAQIHHAMREAGWTRADEITAASTWGIVASTLSGRSYPEAPVSPLFLFGRRQDFAYQQEVDGNPGKRHHVRFWRCPDGWLLPGGRRVDWLAAGTYDRSVGLSLFTLQITHKIDENTDIERDYIVRTVSEASPQVRVEVLADFSSGYHCRNGGGDSIVTDGDLPVLDVRGLDARAHEHELVARSAEILDSTGHDFLPSARELTEELWSRRPLAVVSGALLIVANALLGVLRFTVRSPLWEQALAGELVTAVDRVFEAAGVDLMGQPDDLRTAVIVAVASIGAAFVLAELVLIVLLLRGSRVARLLLMTVLLANTCGLMVFTGGEEPTDLLFMDLLSLSLQISALMALSSNAARSYAIAANAWESAAARRRRLAELAASRRRGERTPLSEEQRFGIPES
ncbi:MAG: LssY C-terminal domain-containing protein [Pseudoclavibacter sp.]|nr:LssY C-terminal domain-containing protein [Pseudoclavibacter sp.]